MAQARNIRSTILVVGEGAGECRLLEHVRAEYLRNHAGFHATIKDARGRGAGHVVDFAIRHIKQADYDHAAVLLDTDADFNVKVLARAKQAGIVVIASDPCLEAWLLDIAGQRAQRSTADHKRAFRDRFGRVAQDQRVYPEHFPRAVLDGARLRVITLHDLLKTLGV